MSGLEIRGAEDWRELSKAMRECDPPLRRAIRRGLRNAVKPLAMDMRAGGAAAMPKRGGLSAKIARAGFSTRTMGGLGAGSRIEMGMRVKDGYDLKAMDSGVLRHPVFDTGAWVSQSVPAKGFTNAFDRGAPAAQKRLVDAIQDGLVAVWDANQLAEGAF